MAWRTFSEKINSVLLHKLLLANGLSFSIYGHNILQFLKDLSLYTAISSWATFQSTAYSRGAKGVFGIADEHLFAINCKWWYLCQKELTQLFGWRHRVELQECKAARGVHLIPDNLHIFDWHGSQSGNSLQNALFCCQGIQVTEKQSCQ